MRLAVLVPVHTVALTSLLAGMAVACAGTPLTAMGALLDAPSVARHTGAQLVGSVSTANFGRASGLPATQNIPVKGGEDYQFDGVSVRVIPGLHSALDDKHFFGADDVIAADATLPLTFDGFGEGGTFDYLVRLGGHEILVIGSANFIERELPLQPIGL